MPEPTEKADRRQFCKRSPWKIDGREETKEGPGAQQWNEEPRPKTAATYEEGEDTRQDLQENLKSGDRKANCRVFDWATGSEWLDFVEGAASSETKEETSKLEPSENEDDAVIPGTSRTFTMEPLGRSSLKEGAKGTVGGQSPWEPSHGEESETDLRRHEHSSRKIRNGGTPVRSNMACRHFARQRLRYKQL
jgi:hypothetical protein